VECQALGAQALDRAIHELEARPAPEISEVADASRVIRVLFVPELDSTAARSASRNARVRVVTAKDLLAS
jgi:hypothetical protein